MAITPAAAHETFRANHSDALKQIESFIDTALCGTQPGDKLFVSMEKITYELKDMVIRRYTDAGWHVTYQSDIRDGDYLAFQ